jgi:hypothetical protein
MNGPPIVEFRGGARLFRASIVIAIAGAVALVIGALIDARQAMAAYLAAYAYLVTIAFGALIFLMTCHAMRAAWPTLLRRLTEAVVGTLPILAVLFIPIAAGAKVLYPWLHLEAIKDEEARHRIAAKAVYLNLGGFTLRAALYLAVTIFVGYWLRRWSRAADTEPSPRFADRLYAASGVLLPLVALAVSFAGFDWVMTLYPTWYSTMFPVYWFAGGFVAAIALLTVLTAAADRAGLIAGINDSHYYALGRLLLSFVIFWAYVAFFQMMLQWIANKPEEVTFYLARVRGGWVVVSVILVLTQFALPFFLLLSYDLKRRRGPLAAVAAWIVAAHYIDAHWLVMPALRPAGTYRWIDFAALAALAGVTTAFGVHRLRGSPMVPKNDPALPRALRYESL